MNKLFLLLLLILGLLSSCKKFKEKQLHKKRQDILEITITNYSTNNPLDFTISLDNGSTLNNTVVNNSKTVSVNSYIKFDYDCRNKLKTDEDSQAIVYQYVMNGESKVYFIGGIFDGEVFPKAIHITINDEGLSGNEYVYWPK